MDLMESNYGLKSTPPGSAFQIGTISDIVSCITSVTVFLAIGTNAINFWVLQKGKKPHFVHKIIDESYSKETATATLISLNKDVYHRIGLSLDESMDENPGDQVTDNKSPHCEEYDPLKLLYHLVISPIADLIHGNEVTIVPDGPIFLAPFAAFVDQNSRYLSETHTVRLIPTLTSLKMMAECPEQYHSTTGALLVGDPWVAKVRIKGKNLISFQMRKKK